MKPLTNSFRPNTVVKDNISTMSDMEIELNGAEKTALSEADAASAAINEEKDYVPSGEEDEDSSEIDSL